MKEKIPEETPAFGLRKEKENLLEGCIGKYVILTPFGGGNFSAGKLHEITERYFILRPYKGIKCDVEKGYISKMIDNYEFVPTYGTRIRLITRKEIETSITMDEKEREYQDRQNSKNQKNK